MPVSTTLGVARPRRCRAPGRADARAPASMPAAGSRPSNSCGSRLSSRLNCAELGREVRIVERRSSTCGRRGRRTPAAVDQEHLLLGADAAHAGLEAFVLHHLAQSAQVVQQVPAEGSQLRRVEGPLNIESSHLATVGPWSKRHRLVGRSLLVERAGPRYSTPAPVRKIFSWAAGVGAGEGPALEPSV